MFGTESPCDVEILNTAFQESVQYINPVIANRSKLYKNIWRSHIPRGQFPLGKGYYLQNLTFYGDTTQQDAGQSWTRVEKSRPPSQGDAGHDSCRYESDVVGYGFERKEYTLYQTSRRTLDICLNDLKFMFEYEQQMELVYNSLGNVTLGEWETFLREQYTYFCTKYWAAEGLPTFTMSLFDDYISLPAGGIGDIGRLTQDILNRFYMHLYRQCGEASMGMQNGFPVFGLITSAETSKEMLFADPEAREDLRYGNPSMLIDGFGSVKTYKNFAHILDPHTPRYVIGQDADGTDRLNRVWPYIKTPTTIGEAVDVNPAYISAPFEGSFIFVKDVYRLLVPPPNPSKVAKGYTFDPKGYMGDFDWYNIQDRCENIRREKGFFMGVYQGSAEPLSHSGDAIMVLHRRCQELPVTMCAPCEDGQSDAVSVSSATNVSGSTRELIVELAECLACYPGQAVTVTFADSSTANAKIQAEAVNGGATTYQIIFATDDSDWAAEGGGLSSIICA